jgi:hypothetical protein
MAVADLVVEGAELVLHLSRIEKLGGLQSDVRVPLSAVRVEELRGLIRCPGTGWPRVIALGTFRRRGTKAFAAVYRDRPGIVVDLSDGGVQRLVVSTPDADDLVRRLTSDLDTPPT